MAKNIEIVPDYTPTKFRYKDGTEIIVGKSVAQTFELRGQGKITGQAESAKEEVAE